MNPATGSELPTVSELIAPLVDVDDRGVYFEDEFTSWRDHIAYAGALAAALKARLDPARPQHVGVLLQNTPFFSALLVAAGLSGIVPVGLNPETSTCSFSLGVSMLNAWSDRLTLLTTTLTSLSRNLLIVLHFLSVPGRGLASGIAGGLHVSPR